MTTAYQHTLVILCPQSLAPDQTHLSACWSEHFYIGGYEQPNRYRNGQPVIVKGTVMRSTLLGSYTQPPVRHADDTDQLIDMEAALRAWQSLSVYTADSETWPEQWPTDRVLAFVDVPLVDVISMMGLTTEPPATEDGE